MYGEWLRVVLQKNFSARYGYYYDNIDHNGKFNKMVFRLWTYLEDKNDPALELSENYQDENPYVLLITQDSNLDNLFPGVITNDNPNQSTEPNQQPPQSAVI